MAWRVALGARFMARTTFLAIWAHPITPKRIVFIGDSAISLFCFALELGVTDVEKEYIYIYKI